MKIGELFTKPINRPINGVIKADQKDADSVWQELDEYVVTKQLTEYFRRFFDAYLAAADNPNDPVLTTRMGVWVSGFFGSGKSHFIKILSSCWRILRRPTWKPARRNALRRSLTTTRSRIRCCSPTSIARCRAVPM